MKNIMEKNKKTSYFELNIYLVKFYQNKIYTH